MKLSQIGELSLLDKLRKRFRTSARGLILGIGDDAAVIASDGSTLITTDMMVEGVHFDLSWTTPFQLGFKLISVNVSDIYAMGGKPQFVLLNFAAHGNCTQQFFMDFFDGIEHALDIYAVSLIGGDISASDRLMLSATAIGSADTIVRRKGARIGDRIYVTGTLGDAACGLELLRKLNRTVDLKKSGRYGLPLRWQTAASLMGRHLMPLARDSAAFKADATAMIDVSDGLLIDLGRLCRESGVGARLRIADIPLSDALKKAAPVLGLSAVNLALSGGEDYELLFTASPKRKIDAICIGEIARSGITVMDDSGRHVNMEKKGYQHFAVQG
jgi:thiamine-monophosphate kinase